MSYQHSIRVMQRVRVGLAVCNWFALVAIALFFALAVSAQTVEAMKTTAAVADIVEKKGVAWIACACAIVATLGTIAMAKFMAGMHADYMKASNVQMDKLGNAALEVRAMSLEIRNLTDVLRERPCMLDNTKHHL